MLRLHLLSKGSGSLLLLSSWQLGRGRALILEAWSRARRLLPPRLHRHPQPSARAARCRKRWGGSRTRCFLRIAARNTRAFVHWLLEGKSTPGRAGGNRVSSTGLLREFAESQLKGVGSTDGFSVLGLHKSDPASAFAAFLPASHWAVRAS